MKYQSCNGIGLDMVIDQHQYLDFLDKFSPEKKKDFVASLIKAQLEKVACKYYFHGSTDKKERK